MPILKKAAVLIAIYIFTFHTQAKSAESMTLEQQLEQAITGDRTGMCLVVAKVGQKVQRAKACANKKDIDERGINFDTEFEIGSISKLMAANVLAGLIDDGKLTLNDTLESILPDGFKVPTYKNKPILLKHVVTHSSGLPPIPSVMTSSPSDPENPYKSLSVDSLMTSLEDVTLNEAPGTQMQYSNYTMMLLSLGLAHSSNMSFDAVSYTHLTLPTIA